MESQVRERILSMMADGVEKFPSSLVAEPQTIPPLGMNISSPLSPVQSISSCSKCALAQERKRVLVQEQISQHPFFILSEFPELEDEHQEGKTLYSEKSSSGLIVKLAEKLGILAQSHLSFALKCTPTKGIPASSLPICVQQNLKAEFAVVRPRFVLCFGQRALNAVLSLSKPSYPLDLSENNSMFLSDFGDFSSEVYFLSSSSDLERFPLWRAQVWKFLSKFS